MHQLRRAASAGAGKQLPVAWPSSAIRRTTGATHKKQQQLQQLRGYASEHRHGAPGIPGEPGMPEGRRPSPFSPWAPGRSSGSGSSSRHARNTPEPRSAPRRLLQRSSDEPRAIDTVPSLRFVLAAAQQAQEAQDGGSNDTAAAGSPVADPAALEGRLTAATHDAASATVCLVYDGLPTPVHVSTLWLRDSCACPRCVTPSSGQKQFQSSALPEFPQVKSVEVVAAEAADGEAALRITWGAEKATGAATPATSEPHVSTFPAQKLLLALARLDAPAFPMLPARRLWDRALLAEALQPVAYDAWMAGGPDFYRALLDLYQLGIAIVEGVPETVDQKPGVRAVAEQIGNIQNTFYGETFDVVSKPAAENVAYTSEFLCLHQDLLYMRDPPYIQLLHCLHNESVGGESLFSDSLHAAHALQLQHPQHVRTLASTPVRYHYERNGHYYYFERPVLEFRNGPRVQHTAWSPPFQDAFAGSPTSPTDLTRLLVKTTETTNIDTRRRTRLHHWRAGAAVFQALIEHPDHLFEVKMQPGQCVLFNNRRVLHGRRQFEPATGARHLQGTYIDEQTFTSRVIGMVREGHLPPGAWGTGGPGTSRRRPLPPRNSDALAAEQAQVARLLEARLDPVEN